MASETLCNISELLFRPDPIQPKKPHIITLNLHTQWDHTAIAADSKLLVSLVVGKRAQEQTRALGHDAKKRLRPRRKRSRGKLIKNQQVSFLGFAHRFC